MTILRVWHGYTTPENADAYEELLTKTIMPGIKNRKIPGYLGHQVVKRVLPPNNNNPKEIEFMTILRFRALEDIKGFVGEDYEKANLPEPALKLFSRYDERAQHYEVREED